MHKFVVAATLAALMLMVLPRAGHAQAPHPLNLPPLTLDCFQSFATGTALPEVAFFEVPIDGDNFEKPTVRYRLQVVDLQILKIIERPNDPAARKEHGKHAAEIIRDFMRKHNIVGWRENSSTGLTLFTINFEDGIFTVLKIPNASVRVLVGLQVFKCREAK